MDRARIPEHIVTLINSWPDSRALRIDLANIAGTIPPVFTKSEEIWAWIDAVEYKPPVPTTPVDALSYSERMRMRQNQPRANFTGRAEHKEHGTCHYTYTYAGSFRTSLQRDSVEDAVMNAETLDDVESSLAEFLREDISSDNNLDQIDSDYSGHDCDESETDLDLDHQSLVNQLREQQEILSPDARQRLEELTQREEAT